MHDGGGRNEGFVERMWSGQLGAVCEHACEFLHKQNKGRGHWVPGWHGQRSACVYRRAWVSVFVHGVPHRGRGSLMWEAQERIQVGQYRVAAGEKDSG
jgi:hypothetical protein